jgi:hypothetical protein
MPLPRIYRQLCLDRLLIAAENAAWSRFTTQWLMVLALAKGVPWVRAFRVVNRAVVGSDPEINNRDAIDLHSLWN